METSNPATAARQGLRQRYLQEENAPRNEELRPGYTVTDTTAPTEPGPDIEWIPSYETYRERVKRLAAERSNKPLDASLPDGFPKAVGGDRVWAGDELCEDDYFVHLDEADVGEIAQALEEFICKSPLRSSPADFVLWLTIDAIQSSFPRPTRTTLRQRPSGFQA